MFALSPRKCCSGGRSRWPQGLQQLSRWAPPPSRASEQGVRNVPWNTRTPCRPRSQGVHVMPRCTRREINSWVQIVPCRRASTGSQGTRRVHQLSRAPFEPAECGELRELSPRGGRNSTRKNLQRLRQLPQAARAGGGERCARLQWLPSEVDAPRHASIGQAPELPRLSHAARNAQSAGACSVS